MQLLSFLIKDNEKENNLPAIAINGQKALGGAPIGFGFIEFVLQHAVQASLTDLEQAAAAAASKPRISGAPIDGADDGDGLSEFCHAFAI